MAPPTKIQKTKSRILAHAEMWAGIVEEIPFLDELGSLEEAVDRGKKAVADIELQVGSAQKRLQALMEKESEVKATGQKNLAENRKKVSDLEFKAKELETLIAATQADAEAVTQVKAAQILDEAEKAASAHRRAAEEILTSKQKSLIKKVEALEASVKSLTDEEARLQNAIKEAREIKDRLMKLEAI